VEGKFTAILDRYAYIKIYEKTLLTESLKYTYLALRAFYKNRSMPTSGLTDTEVVALLK